jgi:hypothetical protein
VGERAATADLVQALSEIDARELYLREGCASLFTYCTERLHLSEHAAYRRIEAARLARRSPLVLERLREGALTLTAASLLAPHLTEANCREVLDAARHKSKRVVEELVAELRPQPDVPTSIRRLPAPPSAPPVAEASTVAGPDRQHGPLLDSCGGASNERTALSTSSRDSSVPIALGERCSATGIVRGAGGVLGSPELGLEADGGRHAAPTFGIVSLPPRRAEVRPLSPARYSLHLTMSAETHRKLRRAQELLRHVLPTGDPAEILDRALDLLVAQLERRTHAELRPKGARKRRAPHVGGRPESEVPTGAGAGPSTPGDSDGPMAGSPSRKHNGRRRSRHIPAAVRRAVWERDGGQCTFVGTGGRCAERAFLEFHHRVPFADGGATDVDNLTLHCRAHNSYEDTRFAPLVVRERCVPYRLGPDRVRAEPRVGKKACNRGGRLLPWFVGSVYTCRTLGTS